MTEPLLAVDGLVQHFDTKAGTVRAVDGVSFELQRGETLGLVGESGCGKSSVARSIAGLYRITGGEVRLNGMPISTLSRRAVKPHRSQIQMVFQNPSAALNPRLTVGRAIEEPLIVHRLEGSHRRRMEKVHAVMEQVGLSSSMDSRMPHELSGGQRQRACIARALVLEPSLIICDEAVSALDVSVQAQVVNLLRDLQQNLGVSYLFISHGLTITRYISHRIAVMYLGRIVEEGPSDEIFSAPRHPYTRALISAAPNIDQVEGERFAMLEGELPSPLSPPAGCHFHPRCPFAIARCSTEAPALVQDGSRSTACHRSHELGLARAV